MALNARELIAAERRRQVEVEGYSPDHDDEHSAGELLIAANLYYHNAIDPDPPLSLRSDGVPYQWPWSAEWWKPKDPQRDLERAGALCRAEIERLERAEKYCGHAEWHLEKIVYALDAVLEGVPVSELPLRIEYDQTVDVVTIEGIRYSGSYFRDLGHAFPVGYWFQILDRGDGTLTIQRKEPAE